MSGPKAVDDSDDGITLIRRGLLAFHSVMMNIADLCGAWMVRAWVIPVPVGSQFRVSYVKGY